MGYSLCGCEPNPTFIECIRLPHVWHIGPLRFDLLNCCHLPCLIHGGVMCDICWFHELITYTKELQKWEYFIVYQRYKWGQDLWYIRLVWVWVWTVWWRWRGRSFKSFCACGRRVRAPSSGLFNFNQMYLRGLPSGVTLLSRSVVEAAPSLSASWKLSHHDAAFQKLCTSIQDQILCFFVVIVSSTSINAIT